MSAATRRAPPVDPFKRLLYPVWDAGWQVGHAVGSPKELVARAVSDLHAATALLSARFVAGEEAAFDELVSRHRRWIERNRRPLMRRLMAMVVERRDSTERAGWALAPDIKEDIGGLRDAHIVGWMCSMAEGGRVDEGIVSAAETLLAVREALHGRSRRKVDRLRMDLQPDVATSLGILGEERADALMSKVHASARTIEHLSTVQMETLVDEVLPGPRRSGTVTQVAAGVRIEDGLLVLDRGSRGDPAAAMRLLAAHASSGRRIGRSSLASLDETFSGPPLDRWDHDLRASFFDLLQGPFTSLALETLDLVDAWPVLLPEWTGIRGRAQHDPYHRYTVDGHSFLCANEITRAISGRDLLAGTAAREAGRLKTLYLAALLHDVGKGSGEDHSVAGERLAMSAAGRIGMEPEEATEVATLVRHHLLLADTATRRDLDDGAVIAATAETIGDPRLLRLLYVLTVADGRSTGPFAWNEWKASLVRELYRKTLMALEKGEIPTRSDVAARSREVESYEPTLAGRAEEILSTLPPSYLDSTSIPDMVDEIRMLLDPPGPGEVRVRFEPGTEADQTALIACVPDRPGALGRTAGTLSLNRVAILRAQAFSTTTGIALQRFIVDISEAARRKVIGELEAVYSGRLALEAELQRKARTYNAPRGIEPEVRILQDASPHSTVIEVRSPDALGLLFAIAAAVGELDLDIHVAKIDTMAERVVDVFYVRTPWGAKLSPEQGAAVERAIRHRIATLLGGQGA